ncbi:MAG: hypothetical protein SGARI_004723 [Bacillariaceae sp.]
MAPPDGPAGSFFHPVPDEDSKDDDTNAVDDTSDAPVGNSEVIDLPLPTAPSANDTPDDLDDAISKLIQQRRKKPLASQPSTINGVPTEKATGFGKTTPDKKSNGKAKNGSKSKGSKPQKASKPYVAIGPTATPMAPRVPINDPSKPEMDDQGYTLYTDEETGEKSRVFEALVQYPCDFTMKIVGANEGTFVEDILAVVADATESKVGDIKHSTKAMGKWTSVTVQAPF